jgi:hypothetical protein
MFENFSHDILLLRYYLLILTVIISFITGVLMLRHTIQRRNFDLALAIFIALYAIILAFLPVDHYLWNYLGIGYGFLFLVFFMKVVFGDIIMKGSIKERIYLVLGIILIVAVLILARYTTPPAFFDYIPVI